MTRWSRVSLSALVGLSLLVAIGAPASVQAGAGQSGPTVIDLGDGTIVLERYPSEAAAGAVAGLRFQPRLPSFVPGADIEQLPGDVYSTYPADFDAALPARSLLPGPVSIFDGQVVGADNRTRVKKTNRYPSRATVHIYITTPRLPAGVREDGGCSGGIVGAANLVITAAHCVFDPDLGRWNDDFLITPGRKSRNGTPYGSCGWRRAYIHRKWMTTGRREYDTAAIVMDCKVGDRTGWYGAYMSVGSGFIGGSHDIYQYPGDKPFGTQWHDAGPWSQVGTFRATPAPEIAPSRLAAKANNGAVYTIDTAPGSSGSSVIKHDGSGGYDLTAVHVAGSPTANYGVLLWKQTYKKVILKAYRWAIKQ